MPKLSDNDIAKFAGEIQRDPDEAFRSAESNAMWQELASSPEAMHELWNCWLDIEALLESRPSLTETLRLELTELFSAFRILFLPADLPLTHKEPVQAVRARDESSVSEASFAFLRPEFPGAIFHLKIRAEAQGLSFQWHTTGHLSARAISLSLNGEWIESQSYQSDVHFFLERSEAHSVELLFQLIDNEDSVILLTKIAL